MLIKKIGFLWPAGSVKTLDLMPRHVEQIKKILPDVEVVRVDNEDDLIAKAADCDVFMTPGILTPDKFFGLAKNLKWVQCSLAGVDKLVVSLKGKGVTLTSMKGIHGKPMSEHTLGMIIAFARGFHILRDQQNQKIWKRYSDPDEILNKTVGMVGLGSIGREVARKCKLMGMRVIATKRSIVEDELVDKFYPVDKMNEMLGESDYVVVITPSTPETRHLIGEAQLRAMKPSGVLINIARGDIVDTNALIKALKEGWIKGAGLDVTDPEPLPAANELWGMPNVIISPHMAAVSPLYMDRATEVFCDNLTRYTQGKELLFLVDWNRGY